MSSSSPQAPRSAQTARRHYLLAAGFFVVLGFHVGVWAVQLPRLADSLHLRPGALGAAISAAAAAGIVTLFGGGRLADRFGRRPVLLTGFGGTAAAFALLSTVHSMATLIPVFILYGLLVSFIDLGANTVGSDFERAYDRHVMTGLHAGFSLGALVGALSSALLLWAGVNYRVVYLLLAVVLTVATLVAATVSLPPWEITGEEAAKSSSARGGVWRISGVALAIIVVTVTFFGDGALESFLGVYLARWHASGGVLTGVGIGGYHLASLIGRLSSTRLQKLWGERRSLLVAGLLAAAGIIGVVSTADAAPAICGLLIVGFAIAPIVPTALSLAGRSAPGRSGQAVAMTTAAGYSAFIVSPVLIGGLADATSLRTAFSLLILTTLTVAALSSRWPTQSRATATTEPVPVES